MIVGLVRASSRLSARAVPLALALLLAFVAALFAVVSVQAPAYACSCAAQTMKQQIDRADVVFVGEVVGSTVVDQTMTYDVLAERVFKGELESAQTQVSTSSSTASCGLGEIADGERYLFLTQAGQTNLCSGSAPASTDALERVQRQLGVGTRVEPPAPEAATRTKVEDSDPQQFTRLAAPGAALVLLGLLGLAVVRRMGRAD